MTPGFRRVGYAAAILDGGAQARERVQLQVAIYGAVLGDLHSVAYGELYALRVALAATGRGQVLADHSDNQQFVARGLVCRAWRR